MATHPYRGQGPNEVSDWLFAMQVTGSIQQAVHGADASSTHLAGAWQLTECSEGGQSGRMYSLIDGATTVGRASPAKILLNSAGVSKQHAELSVGGDAIRVRDLKSTNGTFVNGTRIEEVALKEGDLLQFANAVFRVTRARPEELNATREDLSLDLAETMLEMESLLNGDGIEPHYQPIVYLADARLLGHEMLARTRLPHLRNPLKMFEVAANLGQERYLSELLRREGVKSALQTRRSGNLFLNTHPKEIVNRRFLDSLCELRELVPTQVITIEVHEASATNKAGMQQLRSVLDECSMHLAYDDFGAGQARLNELTEVPPDYLKFDMALIRDIDNTTTKKRFLVESLVRIANDLGITTLAEGIETEGEAKVCLEAGFTLAQGYFYGRPAPTI